MSLVKDAKKLADKELDKVSGGVTAAYFAAQDVIRGKYGVGEERRIALEAAGYNYYEVQRMICSTVQWNFLASSSSESPSFTT